MIKDEELYGYKFRTNKENLRVICLDADCDNCPAKQHEEKCPLCHKKIDCTAALFKLLQQKRFREAGLYIPVLLYCCDCYDPVIGNKDSIFLEIVGNGVKFHTNDDRPIGYYVLEG